MIDRRTLLTGLAAAALSIAKGRGQGPQAGTTLNLVLHGLFVMEFTPNNLQLMTPKVSEHRYLASGWDPNDLSPLRPENEPFQLTGVKKLGPYDPSKLKRGVILSKKQLSFSVDATKAYLTTSLPWPQDFVLLRFASRPGGGNIFKHPPLNTIKDLSLCQALTYPVDDLQQLGISGTTWRPKNVDPVSNTVNLHLWAEPDHVVPPSHAAEAFAALGHLLPPLNFELEAQDVTASLDSSTGVKGLPVEQEKGLSEWLGWGKARKPGGTKAHVLGTSGSNCGLMMVVP